MDAYGVLVNNNDIMIENKKDLHYYIKEDELANGIKSQFQYYLRLFFKAENACVVHYLHVLRREEYFYNNKKTILNRLAYYWYKLRKTRLSQKYSIGIMVNTVGAGLHIPHIAGGVIINCKSMGEYCTVNGGVVIGRKNSQDEIATIGKNVTFSVGCKVFGKICIGDNVFIAPNAVVFKDISSNSIVGGIPAYDLKQKNK